MKSIAWSAATEKRPSKRALEGSSVLYRPGSHFTPEEVIDHCRKAKASSLIVLSSLRVYGALPGHNMHFDESTSIADKFDDSDLAALAASDAAFAGVVEHQTRRDRPSLAILRPVHVTAGVDRSPLISALTNGRIRTRIGFDPIVSVLHQHDLTAAIEIAAQENLRGAFNVVGPGSLPVSVLVREAGTSRVGGIGGVVADLLERVGRRTVTRYSETELCYPIIPSDTAFRSATGWKPKRSLPETIASLREEAV